MHIDEAVVISRPDRPQRLQAFLHNLPQPWPMPAIRVAPGVVAEPPPWWNSSAGAWGCRTAHLNVLQDAWERGVKTLAVFEDDARFIPDFAYGLRKLAQDIPPSWSMLMLGGQHIQEPMVWNGWARCRKTRRTHAYVVRSKALPLLIRTWTTARRHIDHALSDVQAQTQVYAPETWLVGQRAGVSDISGIVSETDRFWDEPDQSVQSAGQVPLKLVLR